MGDHWPRIVGVKRTPVSPWLEFIAREVQFHPKTNAETYYSISQPAYLAAVAVTPEGRILLVRQYRPAIERSSLEFQQGCFPPVAAALLSFVD